MVRWFVDRLPQRGIPSVSLRRLLPEARFVGCHDWEVSGCTADSRRLEPGQVFVAVRGSRHDGHAFVAQAMERGAAGVIVERPCPEAGRLQAIVSNARVALARICQALAGDPAEQLTLIGVTGTSGRTLASLFLRAIFEAGGARFGLVGSLGWSDGVTLRPGGRDISTPRAWQQCWPRWSSAAAREAFSSLSAAALERRRVEGLGFDAALVTDVAHLLGNHHAIEELRETDGSRRVCFASSWPAAPPWSTPTTRMPSCSARSTSSASGLVRARKPRRRVRPNRAA